VLQGVQRPAEEPVAEQIEEVEEAFVEIARKANGDFIYASNPSDLIDIIESLLKREEGNNIDVVICLDTTGSMGKYIDSIRRMLIPMMRKTLNAAADWRIGMVLYRDYPPDAYITKIIPFTKDFSSFQRNLNAIVTWGGGDVPEAVYEALYDGADKFPWAAESRLLILAGDAPPHPVQRGGLSQEMALQKIAEKGLQLSAILLTQ
jgi:Mg-chelatase subunit ChlD